MNTSRIVIVAALAAGLAAADAAADVRYLALGDSYTAGTGIDARKAWPTELASLLRDRGIPTEDPIVIAGAGWTTGDLLAAMEDAGPKGPFDLVTVMIGANNVDRGMGADAYRRQLREILAQAIKLAGGDGTRVVGVEIPDYSATPYGKERGPEKISAAVKVFNAILREETRKRGVRYVDLTWVTQNADRNPDLTGPDGLHPSASFHAVWARLVYPFARSAAASKLRPPLRR